MGMHDMFYQMPSSEDLLPYVLSVSFYVIADFLWVLLVPTCVRSPGSILFHHIFFFILMLVSITYPEFRYLTVYTMIIEVNTWLLILRRHLVDRIAVVEALFLSTWIL